VLFLSQGDTKKYVHYVDPRTRTSEIAIRFAAGTGLVGVNLHSEDILRNSSPIALAKRFNLITFVWGDELAERLNVDHFKNTLGVDGIIYDR
jgi:glycerophosphocholine phosphodiesterase GPCPD1